MSRYLLLFFVVSACERISNETATTMRGSHICEWPMHHA